MGRYRKVSNFPTLPLRERQRWAQEFIDQAEQRMSSKRKGQYHRLVVRYVWSQLNAGAQYVTEDQVVRRIRSFSARKRARLKSSKNPI